MTVLKEGDLALFQHLQIHHGVEAVEGVEVEDDEEELDDLFLGEMVVEGFEKSIAGLFRCGVGDFEELQDELIAFGEERAAWSTERGDLFFGESLTLSLSVANVDSVLAVGELS